MSERIKRTVGTICICCNIHDRTAKGMHDPEWLEVVGNPTIPHVQSLRQPPASVALPVSNDRLIGLTNKNASRRYLRKLQRERERNQEVLSECVDNLPIVIRQLAYPESPPNKSSHRNGIGNAVHSAEKKFRIGRLRDDFWQENAEQWIKDDADKDASPRTTRRNGSGENAKTDGHQADDAQNGDGEFVHHTGFMGVPNQSSTLKYRFGKKKANLSTENSESQTRSTFRPKGFGALYDEMEFERRYKKVFDLNKHIHFVHSNFLSGQRISKRAKLPPIGHNPSIFSDPTDGGDIFAIMSVQKYNHPEDIDSPHSIFTSSSNGHRKSDGSPRRQRLKRQVEIPKEVDVPIGFVPGTISKTGQSPFDGVKGVMNIEQPETHYRLPSWMHEADSAIGVEEHEGGPKSERSTKSVSNKAKAKEEIKNKTFKKKRPMKHTPEKTFENKSDDEGEPFNISVHVELRPKEIHAREQDDVRKKRSQDNLNTYRKQSGGDDSPRKDNDDSPKKVKKGKKTETSQDNGEDESRDEKILYPTRLPSREKEAESIPNLEPSDHVIWPKNITTSSNQYGLTSQKVRYPDRFVLEESLAEEDEITTENSNSQDTVPKVVADAILETSEYNKTSARSNENSDERKTETSS